MQILLRRDAHGVIIVETISPDGEVLDRSAARDMLAGGGFLCAMFQATEKHAIEVGWLTPKG